MAEATGGRPNDEALRRYAFIDALRGMAVLGVLLIHTSGYVPVRLPEAAQVIARQGARGVQLFFVVSALTLFLSLDLRRRRGERTFGPFFVRRFFRIAPLFWCAALYYPLVVSKFGRHGWAPEGTGWGHVLLTAAFLHGWHPGTINSAVPGGWSVAVEMAFYLTVPLLFLRIKDLRGAVWCLLFALLAAPVLDRVADVLFGPLYRGDRAYLLLWYKPLWFPAQLPVFLIGIVLYFRLKDFLLDDRDRRASADRSCANALLTLCVFLLLALSSGGYPYLSGDVLYAAVFALFAEVLARSPTRLFVNPVTCYLGKISYSIYLCHLAVLTFLEPRLAHRFAPLSAHPLAASAVYYAVTLAASALIATVTYHLVEVPGMAVGRVLVNCLRARHAVAPASPARRAA